VKKILKILLILLIFAGLTFAYKKLVLFSVECQSQYGPCDNDIISELEQYKGESIFTSYGKINNLLRSSNKVINFEIKFISPLKLFAHISQRKPSIAVIANGDKNYHLYSQDGFLLSQVENTQLPTIEIQDYSVISEIQTKFIIEMAHMLNQTYNINNIIVRDGGMEFEIPGSPKIIYPIQGDIDVLLGSLRFVLSQLNTQLGDFTMESVDFRFRNPIIRTI